MGVESQHLVMGVEMIYYLQISIQGCRICQNHSGSKIWVSKWRGTNLAWHPSIADNGGLPIPIWPEHFPGEFRPETLQVLTGVPRQIRATPFRHPIFPPPPVGGVAFRLTSL